MKITYYKNCDGETIDLGNLNVYSDEWKNKTSIKLWEIGWSKAGKSLYYMQYIHPNDDWGEQKERINKLCIELNVIAEWVKFEDSPENRLRIMNWLYRFEDEVENQC